MRETNSEAISFLIFAMSAGEGAGYLIVHPARRRAACSVVYSLAMRCSFGWMFSPLMVRKVGQRTTRATRANMFLATSFPTMFTDLRCVKYGKPEKFLILLKDTFSDSSCLSEPRPAKSVIWLCDTSRSLTVSGITISLNEHRSFLVCMTRLAYWKSGSVGGASRLTPATELDLRLFFGGSFVLSTLLLDGTREKRRTDELLRDINKRTVN